MQQINSSHLNKLARHGYKFTALDTLVIVEDPVQCSNGGGKRWVEYTPVVLKTADDVWRFIDARE